jgi:DNA-binding PadR family transcriptional regulator
MRRAPDPREFLPLSSDELHILMSLAAGPLHGYGLIRDVEARSRGDVVLQTGALYRILRRLLGTGLLEECDAPAGEDRQDERRRYYRPTALGRAVLAAEADRMSRLVRAARMAAAGQRPRRA